MSNEAIAERLKLLRKAVGFPVQSKFAERCGISQTAYNNFERATRRISLDEAMKIRRATRVTLDWLYDGDPSGLPLHLAEKIEASADHTTGQQSGS